MSKFKVGDRVVVYSIIIKSFINGKSKGSVSRVIDNTVLEISLDSKEIVLAHYKHCRKLKPKTKVFPKFEGYSYKGNGEDFERPFVKNKMPADTHAMFSIQLSDLDKLSAKQRELYGVKK